MIATLSTKNLRLRAPVLADLPALIAFFASEQSHTVGGPQDERGAFRSLNATIGHWVTRGFGSWHIADPDSDAFLGRVGFIQAPGWDEPELGWAVMAEAEGKGIAFEAAEAARAHGAKHLGLDATISYIRPTNTRSARLAQRLGATLEASRALWLGAPVDIWRHPRIGATA